MSPRSLVSPSPFSLTLRSPRRPYLCLAVLLLALAAGCGQVPTAPPAQGPTLEVAPPDVPIPPTPSPLPYPLPTRLPPPTVGPGSTATPIPGPTPIVLGAEWAPEAERETYVSTTVVVAKVGDGPGEIGFYRPPHAETLPVDAEHFTVDAHGNIYVLDVVNWRVVKFDSQGQFVTNIVLGDAVQGPNDLAVDNDGRVYIYDITTSAPTPEGLVPKVKLLDPDGRLLWETPVPSWFMDQHIMAMRVDEQGTLWVEGYGSAPNAPVIEGQPYLPAMVPLGNAAGAFDGEKQKALAVPGHLLPSGKPMIVYFLAAARAAFVYDSHGQRIYEIPEGLSAIDWAGNMYYAQYQDGGKGYTILKWDPRGRRVASFDLPLGWIRIEGDGTAYCFTMNWQTWDTYYVIRAQHK